MRPAWRAGRGAAALLLFALLVPVVSTPAHEAEPFRTRNLSPLVSIFGIPAWSVVPEAKIRAGMTTELANHYRLSRRGSETLILDGETWRSGLWLERRIGERWSASIEVPYYRQSGGVLDDLIDAWHSAFGLPEGGRNRRSEGQVAFYLADSAGSFYSLDSSGGSVGDVLLGLGRSVGADRRTHLNATLKLPTGDEGWLAGSGAADLAVTLLRSRRSAAWGRPAGFYWGVGGILLGEPEPIDFDARHLGALGILGGGLRPWPRLGFKAQVELHTALYDSNLEEIGDPGVQVTIGGWRELGERGVVELAVNEDLAVSSSPDVVLHLSLRWEFR